MAIHSCQNCTERHMGCHSTCQKYIQEKAEHDEMRKKIQKQKADENALNFVNPQWSGNRNRKHRKYQWR